MGCVSSKLIRKELQRDIHCGVNGDRYPNHVVSLTSTTYGALKLDKSESPKPEKKVKEASAEEEQTREFCLDGEKKKRCSPKKEREEKEEEQAEVINAWELMSDLEEEIPISNRSKKSPKTVGSIGGYGEKQGRSPFKRLNKVGSPKNVKKLTMGKENRAAEQSNGSVGGKASYFTPKRVSKSWGFPEKVMDPLSVSSSRRRKSLSPLFDPELLEAYEKELSEEGQIKKIISQSPSSIIPMNSSRRFGCYLDSFEKKCPPGGENSVVIYTTTLRGIRKTFEDCNTVRSILESHQIRMYERDVSMDSGFKEELRKLMGTKEFFRVPVVFVKGRLIGGADEISKLEEEGKLGILLDQIPRNSGAVCEGCGGIRFMMCLECSGSCKVLGEEQKNMVRCGECNENGLIQCPLCC